MAFQAIVEYTRLATTESSTPRQIECLTLFTGLQVMSSLERLYRAPPGAQRNPGKMGARPIPCIVLLMVCVDSLFALDRSLLCISVSAHQLDARGGWRTSRHPGHGADLGRLSLVGDEQRTDSI